MFRRLNLLRSTVLYSRIIILINYRLGLELKPESSGSPRYTVVVYYQNGNKTEMSKTFPPTDGMPQTVMVRDLPIRCDMRLLAKTPKLNLSMGDFFFFFNWIHRFSKTIHWGSSRMMWRATRQNKNVIKPLVPGMCATQLSSPRTKKKKNIYTNTTGTRRL